MNVALSFSLLLPASIWVLFYLTIKLKLYHKKEASDFSNASFLYKLTIKEIIVYCNAVNNGSLLPSSATRSISIEAGSSGVNSGFASPVSVASV